MQENFDLWVVVEGHSRPGGSTSWCHSLDIPPVSDDGTVEYMSHITAGNNNVLFHSGGSYFSSKDEQFNKAIEMLRTRTNNCFLWQVDCDEHWNKDHLALSERLLNKSHSNVAITQFNQFVKQDVIAIGDWGSSWVNRLWRWRGERFLSHEPSVMVNQSKQPLQIPYKFDHYSYVFEKDVKFKSKYYSGHEMVYQNWKKLDTLTFPCHISNLFGKNNPVGMGNSYLHKINSSCVNVTNPASLNADISC